MVATAERPKAALKEFRLLLDPERVNELRVEAVARSVREGRPVTWAELVRQILNRGTNGE